MPSIRKSAVDNYDKKIFIKLIQVELTDREDKKGGWGTRIRT